MKFGPYQKDVEVTGSVLGTFRELSCFKSILKKLALENGIDLYKEYEWIPLQNWLDIKEDICSTFGNATIYFIGRNVFEKTVWPPHLRTIEHALLSINEAYYMNHRGSDDIGTYQVEKINDNKFLMTCNNPYPLYFNMGLVKGACRNIIKNHYSKEDMDSTKISVSIDENLKNSFWINLDNVEPSGKTPKWINDEFLLLHEVVFESFNVMENMSIELVTKSKEAKQLNEKLIKANTELKKLASIDTLSNLPNRRTFDNHLDREWRQVKRSNEDLSIIICDIDNFKSINDNYGHQVGDKCIRHVSDILSSEVKRPRDLVSRIGGEEFAVILPECPLNEAKRIAEKMCIKVRDSIMVFSEEQTIASITVSLGIAAMDRDTVSKDDLIKKADQAMLDAKRSGKNQVSTYSK